MINTYDVIIQVVSFALGSLISFLMSWYFFKKADFPSKVTAAMSEDVLVMLIQSKVGVDFDVHKQISRTQLPKALTTPHILHYWISKECVQPGEVLHLLFRVEDTDFDFPGVKGIEITEAESNVSFLPKRQGHGYFFCDINCSKNATPGLHTLTMQLKDGKGNSHSHYIKFEVA